MHSPAQSARKIFQPISIRDLSIRAGGGLVDVVQIANRPHRVEKYVLSTGPQVARSLAAALLKAADAAEGLPAGFAS